ncbi:MAG: fibronectin type III domain-containing protein [Planctomycetia bacterium]|nr:fibronectin type III domain-containing protein [Planctomycetia bacterium]
MTRAQSARRSSLRSSLVAISVAVLLAGTAARVDGDPPLGDPASLAATAPDTSGASADWHDFTTYGTSTAFGVSGRIEAGKFRVENASGVIESELTGLDKGATPQLWYFPASTFAGKVATTDRGGGVLEKAESKEAGFEDSVVIPAGWGNKKLVLYGKLTTALVIEDTFDGDISSGTFSTDGRVVFLNASGARCLCLGRVRAVDGAGVVRDCAVDFTQVADGYTFSVTIPAAWMNTATYPVTIDRLLGTPAALSSEYGNPDFESAVASGGGISLVTWTSAPEGATDEDVYGRLVASDGSMIGSTFIIASGSKSQRFARVAFASGSGGVFGVAHKDGNRIIFRRFDTTGRLLSSAVVSDAADTDRVRTVDITSNGTDRFCIAWTGGLATDTNRQTWATVRGADGSLVKGGTLVGPAPGTLFHGQPTVVWNGTAGHWFFTWDEWDDAATTTVKQVEAVAWDAGLAAVTLPEFLVPVAVGTNRDPRVAWNAATNTYLAVWTNNPPTGPTNVLGRRINGADGTLLGSEFNVELNAQRSKEAAVVWAMSSGRWLVGFRLTSAASKGTFGQVLIADGSLTGPLFALSDDADFDEAEVALAWNSTADQALATWTDGSSSTQDIWSVRLDVTPPAAPGAVTASNTSSEIALTWPKGAEADLFEYRVFRATTAGGPYGAGIPVSPGEGPTVSWTDTDVTVNTRYHYVVRAVDSRANESDASVEASEIIDTIAPAAPAGLVATAGSESVELAWTPNSEPDLAGYCAYYREAGTATWTKANTALIGTSSFSVAGLVNGTTYELAITAVDTEPNESALSDMVTATPAGALLPPAAPVGMLAVSGPGMVSLTWTANAEANILGYDIYFRPSGAPDWTKVNSVPVPVTSFTVSGLTTFSLYEFALKAINTAALVSPLSEAILARAGAVPSASPPVVTAVAGSRTVSLSWTASAGLSVAGYDVFRCSTATGTFHRLNGIPITVLTFTDAGLTNGTTYFYRVAAVQGAPFANGSFSAVVSATPQFPAPAGLVLDSTTGTSATMSWGGVSAPDLAGYRVYRSASSGAGYVPASPTLVSTTTFTDAGLTAGTWFWVVTAVATGGDESFMSNEISATVSGIPTPAPPTLDPSNVRKTNDDHPLISGSALAGYVVKIYEGTTLLATAIADGTTGHFAVHTTVLLGDGEHVVQATQQATEADAASSLSSGRVVTVDTTPPATPADFRVLGGDGWVLVEWKENTEPDLLGYNVYRKLDDPEAMWIKLNSRPLLDARYVDREASNGSSYRYRVTAVDNTVKEK